MALNVYKLDNSQKPIYYALQRYYGIGPRTARWLCLQFGISFMMRTNDIPRRKIVRIYKFMDRHLTLENELRVLVARDIQNLMQIKCFRGVRLEKGLPVRGQRARTNGNTQRKHPIKKLTEI
jgi:small subunit ribosomal protein S13